MIAFDPVDGDGVERAAQQPVLQLVAEDGDVAVQRVLAEEPPVLVVHVQLAAESLREGELRDARAVALLGVRDVLADQVQG